MATPDVDSPPASAVATELLGDLRDANAKLLVATSRSKDLAEEAAQAEALFNALPDVIARYDGGFRHVYLNAAVERVTGRPRSAFLGKTTAEVGLLADHLSQWNWILTDTFERARSVERFFTFDLREGRRVFHVRTIPEYDIAGAVTSVVAIARDVTESEMYHAARADADRLRRIQMVTAAFSSAPTPRDIALVLATQAKEAFEAEAAIVMLLDDAGRRLVLVSALGYPDDVVARWSDLPLDTVAPLTEVVRSRTALFFATHGEVLERYPSLAQDRHGDDEALAAVPLTFDDRAFGAVALVFRQVRHFADTDRAFLVNLAQHSAQAIDRARLLEAERAARQEAEAANGLKDDFLATMSHELRTPLNAVMGWATLLRAKTTDTTLVERGLEAIERNARVQARLIEDVLDVSRIISGKLQLDFGTVDVGSVVSAAVDVLRGAADAKNIVLTVTLDDVCVMAADASRLQQIVWNLVSNAVKFTPDGGRVDVSVHRQGQSVVIRVRDTGAGIPSAFLPRVFDRFRQLDGSTTRRQGGLGLGLAIVRQLVELHGGTVVAESDGEGRGASFTVVLPGTYSDHPTPLDESRISSPRLLGSEGVLEGLSVLVVDDEDDARQLFGVALHQCGATVYSASSAADAFVQLASVRPAALVCDIGMPGTDGYTLIRELRARPAEEGGATPAIAVTGFARREDVDRALAAGFQRHFAKPVDLGQLIQAVAALCRRT